MSRQVGLPEDDPLRAFLPVALPLGAALVVGLVYPIVVAVLVQLIMLAAVVAAAFVAFCFLRKFIGENYGPGGILEAWRPSVGSGLGTAVLVVIQWLPLGILSILVFGANGLIVEWTAFLLEWGIRAAQAKTSAGTEAVESVRSGWKVFFFWGPMGSVLDSTKSAISGFQGLLVNALVLLRYFLVLESFVSWLFLMWLTIRTTLYFLSRQVLASRPEGTQDVKVRFDMEFLE